MTIEPASVVPSASSTGSPNYELEPGASSGTDPVRSGVGGEKKRWPRAAALEVASELCAALKPSCSRLIVAGSLRRRKADVGDVEIIYIPRFEDRQFDMFTVAPVNLADKTIGDLLNSGALSKRASKTGSFAWGAKNKLAVHRSGIPVDLFAATESNWWNYLVCRTGPADSNTRICMAAQQRGWKWNPYGAGFSRGGPLAGEPEEYIVTSEEDVFRFVGLPFAQPEDRR